MRPFVLLLLLPACASLASEDHDRLVSYQRNAKLFFDGGKWNQAMIQIERGLELEPQDYMLNSMKGGILLLGSGDAHGTDHKKLDEATALLASQFETRSISRHEPHLLLNYARALQKQGLRHLGEAVRLEGHVARNKPEENAQGKAEELETMREQAKVEREQAVALLQQANELLGDLVQRGEMLRLAHNHRLQIALQLGDDKGFLAESDAYFKQVDDAQKLTEKRIEGTKNVDYEQEQLGVRRQLIDEELQVRTLVAEFHYTRKNYKEAEEQLTKVLKLDPGRFIDYYNRGRVRLELGRVEDAKSDFRRFLSDPSIPASSEKAAFALQTIDK